MISFNLRELGMDPEGQERGTAQKGWVEGSRQQESGDHPQGRGGEFRFPPCPLLPLWVVTLSPWVASPPPSSYGGTT